MDYQAERQEGSYHLIMTLSLGISKLLEAFYEACSMSKTVLDKVVAPMLEPTLLRHYSFKNKLWPKKGSASVSYKVKFTQLQKQIEFSYLLLHTFSTNRKIIK